MSLVKACCSTVVILGLFLMGCSGAGSVAGRQPVFKASGKITMSGGPVANAAVSFSPKAKQPVAVGRTDANGQYKLTTYASYDGAAAGDYVVLVIKEVPSAAVAPPTAHDPTGSSPINPSQAHSPEGTQTAPTSGLPTKYSRTDESDLTATVTASGVNEFNFELKP